MIPPVLELHRLPDDPASDRLSRSLAAAAVLPNFLLMNGTGEARWRTSTRVGWDESHFHVEFECADEDAWGTKTGRDQPLWQEEVVEVFVAAGEKAPTSYCEFEVSPLGALFDARIGNPHGDRRELTVDVEWDCDGVLWRVDRSGVQQDWRARIAIPWSGLNLSRVPRTLRANFFRIERPRGAHGGEDEFSGWSPTLTSPPDFHRPLHFGLLHLFD